MSDSVIHDLEGRPALVTSDEGGHVSIRLASGGALVLPTNLVEHHEDGTYRALVAFEQIDATRETLVEAEERIDIRTEVRDIARVTARTVTEVTEQPVDADGWRETVEVERVAVGRPVETPQGVRVEDGVTIIPVYEEVLVVRKQLVLREEVRLTTRREPVPGPASVALRRQRVEVERRPAPAPGDPGE